MDERWKIAVDRAACLGSGVCAASAPRYFRLKGGKSSALKADVEPDDIVLAVAETCPADAITVSNAADD